MSKRSPDESFVSTPPPSKQPRQETPPNCDGLENIQSISELVKNLPADCVNDTCTSLQGWLRKSDDEINLRRIHNIVQTVFPPSFTKIPLFNHFRSQETFEKNIEGQRKQFCDVLRSIECADDVKKLVAYDAFWSPILPSVSPSYGPPDMMTSENEQNEAVEKSWNADFIDQSPLNGLISHISKRLDSINSYGRISVIVQSSGMGKSRLLDELSKNYFMIPINLRSSDTRGYPPSDDVVRNFLTVGGIGANEAMCLVEHFLLALFNKTTEMIKEMGKDKLSRIGNFRKFMTEGQSVGSVGPGRSKFYTDVINDANDAIKSKNMPPDSKILSGALRLLQEALNADSDPETYRIVASTTSDKSVDVFIMFDEAQTLAEAFDDTKESRYIVLRRSFSSLSSDNLFAFFLSTAGKITQFVRPRGYDPSNRISRGELLAPTPYIYLGFDQLMRGRRVLERWKTLEDVTSLDCAAHMGRPLWGTRHDHGGTQIRNDLVGFAEEKLLCKTTEARVRGQTLTLAQMYAVLSQRLALDANTQEYLFYAANPLESMKVMHEQIANHMRVCVAIGDGIESLRGIAASEPILSEAASRIMSSDKYDFSLPLALSKVLSGYCINQGDRGELLAASFFAWARDKAVARKDKAHGGLCPYFSVTDLFSSLFSEATFLSMLDNGPSLCDPKSKPLVFGDVFRKANMHFNHVIKPQEQKVLARPYLLRFMGRGAAALGANCQPGFDAVYPYLYGTSDLDIQKVGFIIVQVKNKPTADLPVNEIFRKMDPFHCGLISDTDKVDGRFPIPIIRLVFLLAEKQPKFMQRKYASPSHGATILEDGKPLFTSYDYVCSGVSPTHLGPTLDSPDTWKALVNARSGWESFYNVDAPGVLRSQLPGNASHDGHFSPWTSLVLL